MNLECLIGHAISQEVAEKMREESRLPAAESREQMANGTARPEQASTRARTCNPTCFLNREAVRDFLLEQAAGTRAHKFERVSSETLHQVNEEVRRFMIGVVRRLPSKGKTI
jgi:hypothetical protein